MWKEIEKLINLSSQPLESEADLEQIPENYYRFLYHLVKLRKPKVSLEIGVYTGIASTYMTMAAQEYDGWVIGIDLNNFVRRPRKNYYFIQGDSTTIDVWNKISDFCHKHGQIGVVYQDSSHHYMPSRKEWELYSQLLDRNAIWICDDITPSFHDPMIDPPGCGMVKYFDDLLGDKRLYKDILHYGNTQGIILIK